MFHPSFFQEHGSSTITSEMNNDLTKSFFSKENINNIQKKIIQGVLEMSNSQMKIEPQKEENVLIVMKQIFSDHAHFLDSNHLSQQISFLNQKVCEYCIPNIYNNYLSYAKYYHDSQNLPIPLERPKQERTHHNHLEFKGWF